MSNNRLALIFIVSVCCGACKVTPAPTPLPVTPPPLVVEAGPKDAGVSFCDKIVAANSAKLARYAKQNGMPISKINDVCAAACGPFSTDGVDAATSSCLTAAANAKAALYVDASTALKNRK